MFLDRLLQFSRSSLWLFCLKIELLCWLCQLACPSSLGSNTTRLARDLLSWGCSRLLACLGVVSAGGAYDFEDFFFLGAGSVGGLGFEAYLAAFDLDAVFYLCILVTKVSLSGYFNNYNFVISSTISFWWRINRPLREKSGESIEWRINGYKTIFSNRGKIWRRYLNE